MHDYDSFMNEYIDIFGYSDNFSDDDMYEELKVLKRKIIDEIKRLKKVYKRFDIRYFRVFEKNKIKNEMIKLNRLLMSVNGNLDIYNSPSTPTAREELLNDPMVNWTSCEPSELDDECKICLDKLTSSNNIKHKDTNHTFHRSCLLQWYTSPGHGSCPICRQKFGTRRTRKKSNKSKKKSKNKKTRRSQRSKKKNYSS